MQSKLRFTASRSIARPHIRPAVLVRSAAVTAAPTLPKTGQHTVDDAVRLEALSYWFTEPEQLKCTNTSGGVNNVCQYVDTPQGERYILRIYNNGNNSKKVEYEHEVLRQLGQQQAHLSFQVPKALPTLKDGKSHQLLSTSAECCVFYLIPGALARTTSPEEVGRATGELSVAMSKVDMGDLISPIAPYSDLFRAHHAVTREKFFNEVATNPEFNTCREAIDYLADEIQKLEPLLRQYEQRNLPRQPIHGDLHFDNVMVVGDSVSGLLDFEFCAYDWRAMELAVALSKYVGEADPLTLCQRFVAGYAQHGELTQAEVDIIPEMIILRIFSNAVYFVGRSLAKEDGLDSLTTRAGSYARRVKWIKENRQAIIDAITEKIKITQ